MVNVTFKGFWRAVNAIGCVYTDVDRDYFNDSAEFTFIDIDPGYQRLCARQALQYVRFRHSDTDLVRSARQQDFLRQMKQQVTYTELIENRDRLVKIFGRNTATDATLRSRSEVLRLLKLAVLLGRPADPGDPLRGRDRAELRRGQRRPGEEARPAVPQGRGLTRPAWRGARRSGRPASRSAARSVPDRSIGVYDATGLGEDQGLQAVQAGAGGSLPVLYPTLLLNSSQFAQPPRVYKLRAPDGKRYGAYRMVMRRTNANGEYYGLQGTTWKNPPILDSPTEKRTVGGRQYELHFAGDRLRLVAWRTPKAAYWVSNTLLQTLTKKQMMAIARSTRRCC